MNAVTPIKSIGEYVPMIDGPEKVSGRAKYTADLPAAGGLVGRILRSPWSHAEIISVDTSAAEALPGVTAVITGADCDKTFGVLPIARSEHPLARDRARYRGEPIAAVAASDDATAKKALALIRFEVRELPAYISSKAALAEGAVDLHEKRPGNVERAVDFELGDVEAGFGEADLVRSESYSTAEISQAHMETHAARAEYDPLRDRMTVECSTQVPFYVHLMLSRTLEMPKSKIRVIKPPIGGGFGTRTECLNVELICALLARKAGGMVSIRIDREETLVTSRGRPQCEMTLKLGMKKDGRLTAASLELVQRGGAHSGYGIVTILYSGSLIYGIYDIPNVKYHGIRALTNTPPCGAMRGHGTVKTRFAFESLLDSMAREMGLDPFAVRRINYLAKPDKVPNLTDNDLMVNSYGLPECADLVEASSDWKARKGSLAPGRGLGMACSHYVSGAAKPVNWTGEPHATINLKLDFDGSIVLLTGAAEIGQGSSTVLVQCVAEILGISMSRIRIITSDSAVTPKDNGSYSSRVTFMCGRAAIEAAENLKGILVAAAARELEAEPKDIEVLGEIYRAARQDKGLSYEEVVTAALRDSGTITAKGTFTTPDFAQGGKKYQGAAIGSTMGFSYAAQVVEVSVDTDTGRITVEKVWVAHDCGRALNRLTVEGQIEGSVWMGMGQALSEELVYHPKTGLPLTSGFLDYRIPTILDSPPIETHIVESLDPLGPFGAKEAGEGSLAGFLPALTAAVEDAIGIRFTELPLTPDRVFAAIDKKRRSEAAAAKKAGKAD